MGFDQQDKCVAVIFLNDNVMKFEPRSVSKSLEIGDCAGGLDYYAMIYACELK